MLSAIQTRFDTLFDATLGKSRINRIWNGVDRITPATRPMLQRADMLVAFGLGLIGMAVSIWGFVQTNRVPEIHGFSNLWLQADVARLAENMVTTTGNNSRTAVRPILSILLYPFGSLLTALGADPLVAAKTLVVLVMGANAALLSLTVRLLGLPRFAGALFTLLFVTAASFLFWGAVVESYSFSCFTVVMSLFMMLRVKTAHWGWWVLLNVLAFGLLLTNWVFALIAMAVRLKLKPFLAICVVSFSVVVVLSVVQNATFNKAALFFNPETLTRETQYFQPAMEADGNYEEGWRPGANLRSIYVTTVVAMPVYIQRQTMMRLSTTNQNSSFPEGELSPVIAAVAWVLLLAMGFSGAIRRKDLRLPLAGAMLMLAAQTALHLIYGEVTFLYSLHFLPLLILFASMAWFAPIRKMSLGLVAVVIVFAGINNERRLQETVNVADCMADLEPVRQLQAWDFVRDEPVIDLSEYENLDVDTTNLCNTKTPS